LFRECSAALKVVRLSEAICLPSPACQSSATTRRGLWSECCKGPRHPFISTSTTRPSDPAVDCTVLASETFRRRQRYTYMGATAYHEDVRSQLPHATRRRIELDSNSNKNVFGIKCWVNENQGTAKLPCVKLHTDYRNTGTNSMLLCISYSSNRDLDSNTHVHGILNQLRADDTGVGGVSSRSLMAKSANLKTELTKKGLQEGECSLTQAAA
jgi:hypothetical protein